MINNVSTIKNYEQELVILLAKKDLSEKEQEKLCSFLTMDLNWDKVIGMLEIHRVAGIGWNTINKYFFNNNSNQCSIPRLYKYLKNSYALQNVKANEQKKYTLELCSMLEKNKIDYILLKGLGVSKRVYNDLGMRDFNDNDLLVNPKDLDATKEVLEKLGYEQGITKHESKIVNLSRKEMLIRKMSSHEITPFIKNVSNSETFISQHIVDVHFSINLLRKEQNVDLLNKFFEDKTFIKIDEKRIKVLNDLHLLIFLCEHFYKEAISVEDVFKHKDLMLSKLCDIMFLLKSTDIRFNWNELIEFCQVNKLNKQMYFSLKYVNEVFNENYSIDLLLNDSFNETELMNNVYLYNDKEKSYTHENNELIDRVFDILKPVKIKDSIY